jgi:hypothetical protein
MLETFTETSNKHSSGSKEKVLDETFTEPGNTHYSGPKEKVLDETFTEPGNKHSSDPKDKVLDEAFEFFIQHLLFRIRKMFVTWFCACFIQYLLFRTRRMFVVRRYWMKHSQDQVANILLVLK